MELGTNCGEIPVSEWLESFLAAKQVDYDWESDEVAKKKKIKQAFEKSHVWSAVSVSISCQYKEFASENTLTH